MRAIIAVIFIVGGILLQSAYDYIKNRVLLERGMK